MFQIETRDNRCVITFDKPMETLCRSIFAMKELSGLTVNSEYTVLSFFANCVEKLEQYINRHANQSTSFTYEDAINMTEQLCGQLFHLNRQNKSLLWMDIENIYIVDKYYFIYICDEHIMEINDSGNMILTTPVDLSAHRFSSPELKLITTLPAEIRSEASYYCLGAIVIYCLFPDINPQQITIDQLKPIIDTKLYWFLLRSIESNPLRRRLLFV